jgi:putative membrane protein
VAGPADQVQLAIDRTLLAIDRTLLAWLRTGVSLITFGFLIARIGLWMEGQRETAAELRHATLMGGLFVALGTAANGLAVYRYLSFHKAVLANSRGPTSRRGIVAFGGSVVLLGALMGYYVLHGLR